MSLVREPGAPAPYQQIREILRNEVVEGLSPGDRLAAERDLARRFDANRATISRAIASLVTEGLLVRRVGRGTFVADGDGTGRREKTRCIGLVMPYMSGDFPAGIIRSAVRALRERSHKVVLFDSEDSVHLEADELERLAQEGLDGALVMPVERSDNIPLFNRIDRLGLPLVFLDRKPLGLEADLVTTDNFRSAYDVTCELIERGHTRIAHFTWLMERQCTSISERRRGYEQALTDHGIEPDPELICPPSAFPDENRYFRFALAFLRQCSDPVTAVFALHDQFVLRTIAAAASLGLRIPEDIEISGFFDGSFHPVDNVPVLKVVQRQDEIGRLAAELLIQRTEGTGPEGPQTVLVPPDIVSFAP